MENSFCSKLGIWLYAGVFLPQKPTLIPHAKLRKWSIPGFMFTAEECPFYKKKISICRGSRQKSSTPDSDWGERGEQRSPCIRTSLFQLFSEDDMLTEWLLKLWFKDRRGRDMRTKGQNTQRWPKGGESHPQTQAPPLTKVPHPLVGTQVCLCTVTPYSCLGNRSIFFILA